MLGQTFLGIAMPLSWNEIRDRAVAFVREWETESSEDAEAKSFWDEFFKVFGVHRRRVAVFEHNVKKASGAQGFIDLFWPGVLIAEHKSRGKNLDSAYTQATDYFPGLKDAELPRYIIVSDFARIRLRNLDTGESAEFTLADLPKNLSLFSFIAGYETRAYREQDPVNIKAAEKLAELHDALRGIGYEGHELEVYLVRILFCLFADDTGIFMPRSAFEEFILTRTSEDGSDLAPRLNQLFETLNTPPHKRLRNLDEQVAAFPYVNGRLFKEGLPQASFDATMRRTLLACCELDWGGISPAIFGSLFQGIMDAKLRRNLGAHYTSEKNILKLIGPLFMDELREEFDRVKTQPAKLKAFHEKLGTLNFFDPACGCGNFLVISYRELRLLELEVIERLYSREQQQLSLEAVDQYVRVDVDQFHGIEIEEWPAQIAQVAMWLIDHQMNLKVGAAFGQAVVRIPLVKSANIVHGNALKLNWKDVLPPEKCSYILGNPPFVGSKLLDADQRADVSDVFKSIPNGGVLDFVAAWYVKACEYIGNQTHCAFVSTNSICQGEQVAPLWGFMLSQGIEISFAHRTFRWSNEAKGVAAVHCVIIGFAKRTLAKKTIFDYTEVSGEPNALSASHINPYLVDASDVLLPNRSHPICDVPEIGIGNKPIDGGNYLFTTDERDAFIAQEPKAAPWFRRWLGSDEFINGWERWCLWLGNCPPSVLRELPLSLKRVEAVRQFRLASKSAPTQKLASTPTRFHVENIPDSHYLLIPEVSSERRTFIPIGFIGAETLSSNLVKIATGATLFHFGVLTSSMHMAWVRTVCGRMKSDFRYSKGIVYNNFPWPVDCSEAHQDAIGRAAQEILDARNAFPGESLAALYDPLTMPTRLVKAHQALDRAVDSAYSCSGGKRVWSSDAERVAFLFELYQRVTTMLPSDSKVKKTRKPQKMAGD